MKDIGLMKSMLSFDGTKISYVVNQPGKSRRFIVFLHGDGSNYTVYKPFLKKYRDRNWIALNIRNHGGSGRGSISIENMVHDLLLILKQEKVRSCIIVGNCLGATIGVEFTKKFGRYVDSLVLITPFSSETVAMPWLFSVISSYFLLFSRPFVRKTKELKMFDYHKYPKKPFWYKPTFDVRGTSVTNFFTVLKLLLRIKFDIININKRMLVVLCRKDIFQRKSAVYSMAEQNEKINVRIIDSGHNPLTQSPEKLINVCAKFIG